MDDELRRRLEQFRTQIAEDRAHNEAESKVVGSLLVGGSLLFGKRVELAWPDGLPTAFTEQSLKDFGRHLLDQP